MKSATILVLLLFCTEKTWATPIGSSLSEQQPEVWVESGITALEVTANIESLANPSEVSSAVEPVAAQMGIHLAAELVTEQLEINSEVVPAPGIAVNWKKCFQQIFTWNLFKEAKERRYSPDESQLLYEHSTYYGPDGKSAYDLYSAITKAKTTNEAFELRESLFSNRDQFLVGSSLNRISEVELPTEAGQLIQLIEEQSESFEKPSFGQKSLYFDSPVGKAIFEKMNDFAMVIIPGFGSHTMDGYSFAEIVEEANAYYGRPLMRPCLVNGESIDCKDDQSNQKTFQSPSEFYAISQVGFDVLHPMGNELGHSMGSDSDSAAYLADWIRNLPEAYKDKKLIFIGYSKGAPIAHHLVHEHIDIQKRTHAIVTLGGVVQGAIPAQSGLQKLIETAELEDGDIDGLIQWLEFRKGQLDVLMAPVMSRFANLGQSIIKNSSVQSALKMIGIDINKWSQSLMNLQRSAETMMIGKILYGVNGMTPYQRILWNLKNLNNLEIPSHIAIFNLSVLTNVKDFFLPGAVGKYGPFVPPLTVPQIGYGSIIDWSSFSMDNVFLHLSSIEGFEEAPGGLFDTQVAWMDTKSLPLDERPLLDSLTVAQLSRLESELGYAIDGQAPRNSLLPKERLTGLEFIDLGELRGTHWDLAFRQVFKPAYQDNHYVHSFPRKAFLTALLETLTIHALIGRQ